MRADHQLVLDEKATLLVLNQLPDSTAHGADIEVPQVELAKQASEIVHLQGVIEKSKRAVFTGTCHNCMATATVLHLVIGGLNAWFASLAAEQWRRGL